MIKKILFIGSSFVIILILIYGIVIIKNLSANIVVLSNRNEKLYHNLTTLKYDIIDSWTFERKGLNIENVFDEDGQRLNSSFFEFEKPTLIFRFSKIDCSDCVISQINALKQITNEERINYVIIADYANKRNLGLFKRANEINDHVYDCEVMIDGENRTPYFCVYYKGTVSNIFFPDNDFQELTEFYIDKIGEKFFYN